MRCDVADAYRDAKAIFFASWDDALPVQEQLEIARVLGEAAGGPVVFRPHPRSESAQLACEGVLIDRVGALWELLCVRGLVNKQALLAGFSSTAQIVPKNPAKKSLLPLWTSG